MKIEIEKPRTVTVMYRQEKGDKDYGTCLWARFTFDLDHYRMSIDSDRGSFSYGWTPTPKTESFLHLCGRFDQEYLMYKFSSRCVVDHEATWKAVKELVEEIVEDEDLELDGYDWEQIEAACRHYPNERDTLEALTSALDESAMEQKYEWEDLCGAIEKDYPADVKVVTAIFVEHIRPFIQSLENGEED